MRNEDPLEATPPEGIPGALFVAFVERLHDHYPASKRKAERVAVNLLELLTEFYAKVAAEEEEDDG